MIACCTRKFWRYSLMFPRDPCALRRCNSIPLINPYGKLHTLVVHNFIYNLVLLLQDTLKYFGYSENPLCLLPCSSFSAWIHVWIIPHIYRGFVHPQLFMCFTNVFETLFNLPKILSNLLLWKVLPGCIMVNSICIAIFIKILCGFHSEPFIQHVCNYSQSAIDP